MTRQEYEAWLLNESRTAHRVLLVEIDHAEGMIRLGSDAYLDTLPPYGAYDDWIIEDTVLESSLGSFVAVGDVRAVNAGSLDWLALDVRGRECRWLYGDESWARGDFRTIATALVAEARSVGPSQVQFDLVDRGAFLSRRFSEEGTTRTGTAASVIDYLATIATGSGAIYTRVPDARRLSQVSVELDRDTKIAAVLFALADSIGCIARVTHSGRVEVFMPSVEPDLVVSVDDIADDGVSMSETLPAVARVEVGYGTGTGTGDEATSVTRTTSASTGAFEDSVRIDSPLTSLADATRLADEKASYRSTPHPLWSVRMLDLAALVEIGDRLLVEHDDLTGTGLVQYIRRSPLSPFSTVEIEF